MFDTSSTFRWPSLTLYPARVPVAAPLDSAVPEAVQVFLPGGRQSTVWCLGYLSRSNALMKIEGGHFFLSAERLLFS